MFRINRPFIQKQQNQVKIYFTGAGKVSHAEDLHYMWDNGNNSILNKFPEEDGLALHRFVKLWTNFVKYRFVATIFFHKLHAKRVLKTG